MLKLYPMTHIKIKLRDETKGLEYLEDLNFRPELLSMYYTDGYNSEIVFFIAGLEFCCSNSENNREILHKALNSSNLLLC